MRYICQRVKDNDLLPCDNEQTYVDLQQL